MRLVEKNFTSVDNANFSDIKLIKENYTNLKNKLGRIPRLRDLMITVRWMLFEYLITIASDHIISFW